MHKRPSEADTGLASLVLLVDPARKLNILDRLRTMIAREYAVVIGHADYQRFLEQDEVPAHAAVSIHTGAAYLDGWFERFGLDRERFDAHIAYPPKRTRGWFDREILAALDEAYARVTNR